MASEQAFISMIRQHQNIVYKVCNIYMDNAEDREDLFQEITLQAWQAYRRFRGDAQFSTWLYRVALNTAITFLKKEKRQPATISTETLPEPVAYHEPAIEEQLKAMYKAIAGLSKIDKALVALYLEDYSYQQIAEVLGISANNVAVKMNRIKARLRDDSKKYYQPA
ncbi:RNA polymerase sigma factor [Deminuibacter soli]|uniref:Sigma-70 family RNA polymerase sigma factor n=1 Tax=Deminuibacter soli TaxID=2291815 RepID=A0A3E1NJK5_9BACT|nr:sigma-70 family RNA polymerase sigma factor [Deminuibacter soli]RFM28109.1 sigma-70 family RNA polymerase sigma factor [Deminuibacter soli]